MYVFSFFKIHFEIIYIIWTIYCYRILSCRIDCRCIITGIRPVIISIYWCWNGRYTGDNKE